MAKVIVWQWLFVVYPHFGPHAQTLHCPTIFLGHGYFVPSCRTLKFRLPYWIKSICKFISFDVREQDKTHFNSSFIVLDVCGFFVPRLFEEKRRDIVFGIPSFRPSVLPSFRPSVLPSFRPPNIVGTLCAQLLLQFYADSFETLQMF